MIQIFDNKKWTQHIYKIQNINQEIINVKSKCLDFLLFSIIPPRG